MKFKLDSLPARVVTTNLRYLCWKQQRDRSKWPGMLATWLGNRDSVELAVALLSETQLPKPTHIEAIVRVLNLDEQDLVFSDLVASDGVNFLKLNLERLLSSPGKQTKSALAREIGVSPATLSRWIGGKQAPDGRARQKIAMIFGLRSEDELVGKPLFLSYLPVTYGEQVVWLNMCLKEISESELLDLFPALYRVFSKAGSQAIERTSSGIGDRAGCQKVRRITR